MRFLLVLTVILGSVYAYLALRLAPQVWAKLALAGLSREGRMQVYVSAGTGSWGPPVRFGASPELTLIRLTGAPA